MQQIHLLKCGFHSEYEAEEYIHAAYLDKEIADACLVQINNAKKAGFTLRHDEWWIESIDIQEFIILPEMHLPKEAMSNKGTFGDLEEFIQAMALQIVNGEIPPVPIITATQKPAVPDPVEEDEFGRGVYGETE